LTEPHCNYYYYNIIREDNSEATAWVDQIPSEQWCLAYDQGRRWGHITTNLAEAINSVLKKTRNLPISSIILATYTRCNTYFTKRGRQITAMLNGGHVYLNMRRTSYKMRTPSPTRTMSLNLIEMPQNLEWRRWL